MTKVHPKEDKTTTANGKGKGEEKKEKTEEEKKAEKEKNARSNKKAKEMIKDLFMAYRCQIIIGLVGNVVGMAAELTSPLFIGYIIDAIVAKNKEDINRLVIIWLIITVSSSIVNGLQTFLMNLLTQKIGFKLRQDLYTAIMMKDI